MTEKELYELDSLYEDFVRAFRSGGWKQEPQHMELNILDELIKLKKELVTHTYKSHPGSEFLQSERGRVRHIFGKICRDRVVRHMLCDRVLTPELQPYLIWDNGASQKGKGLTFARKQFERYLHNYWLEYHTNEGWLVYIDLSKFFDNIPHKQLKEMVHQKIKSKQILWLFDRIIDEFKIDVSYLSAEDYKDCLKVCFNSILYFQNKSQYKLDGSQMMEKSIYIGDQVSQNAGIFYLSPVDNFYSIVKGHKKKERYMDDMAILVRTKEEAQQLFDEIIQQVEQLGLFVNLKKSCIKRIDRTFTFLQIKYYLSNTGKVVKRINPTAVTRQRKRLKKYYNKMVRQEIPYQDIENAYKSWMGEYHKLLSKKQRKNLHQLYFSLFGKEVRWKK